MLLKNTFLMDWLECKEKIQMEKKKKNCLEQRSVCISIGQSSLKNMLLLPSLIEWGVLFSGRQTWSKDIL